MALSDDQRFAMYTADEIGNAIKKRRRQLKITQKEFAERLGKSERTIPPPHRKQEQKSMFNQVFLTSKTYGYVSKN